MAVPMVTAVCGTDLRIRRSLGGIFEEGPEGGSSPAFYVKLARKKGQENRALQDLAELESTVKN
jgi:hypothetical protein